MAVFVGDDRTEPEREHAKILAQHSRSGVASAAAALARSFRRDDAAADDLLARVVVDDLQRFLDVDTRQDVGRLIRGERKDAVVDGPQRHFRSRARAFRVFYIDVDLRFRRGAELVAIRFDGDVQPLRCIDDFQRDVAEAEGGLAGIAVVVRVGVFRPSFEEQDRHEDVRDVCIVYRYSDGLLRRRELEFLPRAHAFAFGSQKRGRRFPRRLDHDARALTRLVCRLFRHEIDAVVIVALPRRVSAARRVKPEARRRRTSFVVACRGNELILATFVQRNVQ